MLLLLFELHILTDGKITKGCSFAAAVGGRTRLQ
jgi:hypothetical protein